MKNEKFKVGDRVVALKEFDGSCDVELGKVYIVEQVSLHGNFITLESTEYWYSSLNFKPLRSCVKVGSKVITNGYIDEYDNKVLTVSKKYKLGKYNMYYYFRESINDSHNFNIEQIVRVIINPEDTTTLKPGQEVTIAGIKGVVLYRIKGYYISNPVGKNDAFFKELFIANPHEFVDSIVGYKTEKHTYFPEVKTLEDLTKVYLALKERESIYFTPATEEECLEWKVVEKPAMPEESYVYKDGDIITFKSTSIELCISYNQYTHLFWFYIHKAEYSKQNLSKELGIKDFSYFVKSILGYQVSPGNFAKSAEDLTKVINALKEVDEKLYHKKGKGVYEQIENSPKEYDILHYEQFQTFINEISSYPTKKDKHNNLNIFDLSTDYITVEKPEVEHITDIFNYEV